MVRINWTEQSIKDLKNIYDFIAVDSRYYAKRQVLKIKTKTDLIKSFLEIGRVVPEFEDEKFGRYYLINIGSFTK